MSRKLRPASVSPRDPEKKSLSRIRNIREQRTAARRGPTFLRNEWKSGVLGSVSLGASRRGGERPRAAEGAARAAGAVAGLRGARRGAGLWIRPEGCVWVGGWVGRCARCQRRCGPAGGGGGAGVWKRLPVCVCVGGGWGSGWWMMNGARDAMSLGRRGPATPGGGVGLWYCRVGGMGACGRCGWVVARVMQCGVGKAGVERADKKCTPLRPSRKLFAFWCREVVREEAPSWSGGCRMSGTARRSGARTRRLATAGP